MSYSLVANVFNCYSADVPTARGLPRAVGAELTTNGCAYSGGGQGGLAPRSVRSSVYLSQQAICFFSAGDWFVFVHINNVRTYFSQQ